MASQLLVLRNVNLFESSIFAAGSHSSKKWKSTVKIQEEDAYGAFPGINVGSWLEKNVPDINRPR